MPWARLASFLRYIPENSAIKRELNEDAAPWNDGRMVPVILADIYDLLACLRYEFDTVHTDPRHQKPKQPKPYKRPTQKRPKPKPYDYDGLRRILYNQSKGGV